MDQQHCNNFELVNQKNTQQPTHSIVVTNENDQKVELITSNHSGHQPKHHSLLSSSKPTNIDDTASVMPIENHSNHQDTNIVIKVYRKRFFILALFCAFSAVNSFQWIQYSSITSTISFYYGVSNLQVNLTSICYMALYIPFIIHASLLLEMIGLRRAVLMGTFGTALGSLIKWQLGSASFNWLMVGQCIVAFSQLFIISIPPLLAAVWFPDSQVSTATGMGVFGNQLGIALGFIIPPCIVPVKEAGMTVIRYQLNFLSAIVFSISTTISVLTLLFFEDKPKKPPGSASLHILEQRASRQQQVTSSSNEKEASFGSVIKLCHDKHFCFLIVSYGINVGVFYAVSTVLNQMVQTGWPNIQELSGQMGLLIVVFGMIGSIVCGHILDKTHAFKAVVLCVYVLSLVSMILFAFVLQLTKQTWPLYAVSSFVGFFMTGYLPLGFEVAAEITYPHPANTPAGLLNLSAQVFGLILTYASSPIVDYYGDLWANIFLTMWLAVGLALTLIMKIDLKRQRAVASGSI